MMGQAASADQRVDAASRTGKELGGARNVEKALVPAHTPPLSDQLGGALCDPLNQLLGDVEGQSGHKRPSESVCVLPIAFPVHAAGRLHRLCL